MSIPKVQLDRKVRFGAVASLTGPFALLLAASLCAFADKPPQFADVSRLVSAATNLPPASAHPAISASAATNAAVSGSATVNAAASAKAAANAVAASFITSMDELDDKHKLVVGDRLSYRVIEDEEDPKTLYVTDAGDIDVPYLGLFPAKGKTCKELAKQLKAALEKDYYYKATVIIAVDIAAKSLGRVYLVGPVRMAGPQDIPSDEVFTLSKAILRAGGFSDFADKRHVRITRKEPDGTDKTIIVDVGEILDKGRTEKDVVLQPGDLIYIREKSVRF